MKTLYWKDSCTALRANDIVRVEYANGKAEISFLRADPDCLCGQSYRKLYFHKIGDNVIDNLLWCPRALAANILNLICAVTHLEMIKLEGFHKRDPYASGAQVEYYKVVAL